MSAPQVRRAVLLGLLVAVGSWAPAAAQSQSLDGSFAGLIRCDALPQKGPLRTKVTMTVAGGMAKYEREIYHPTGGPSGVFERGQGSVGPGGEVTLKIQATAQGYSYDAEYRGTIEGSIARFTGAQYWKGRGETGAIQRPCTLELMRNPS